MSVLM